MICVGNIANSDLFQHAVKTKYPEKQIITPDGAIDAAVKGAVCALTGFLIDLIKLFYSILFYSIL
jgi:hypothetical protein